MTFEVKVTIAGKSIRRQIDGALEDLNRRLPPALGRHAVRDLEGSRSNWPEDTGESKRSFGFDVRGQRIDITNSASDSAGKPYPLILERRGHYAEDTLRRDLSQWGNAALDDVAANVQRDLDKERPSTR